MVGRDRVDSGVVVKAVLDAVQRLIADGVWKGFPPALDRPACGLPARIAVGDNPSAFSRHRRAVDVKQVLFHLDAVAGNPTTRLM